jgi:NAD(P)-dependent dehydrogenase (short-subunit alcohol dehydrogenase family)
MGELTAVVTGAATGIGRAIAARLLQKGYRVVGLGRRRDALDRARRELGADAADFVTHEADVRDDLALVRAFEGIGPVHAVVANAGVVRQSRLDALDARETWRYIMATNLDGVFNTLHAAVPHLPDSGRVVVISSGLGKLGRAAFGAYAASKHGVLGLVKCLAKELADRKITVNAVCPGWVDTDMARADVRQFAERRGRSMSDIEAEIVQNIPVGRFVQAAEVASLVAWLLSNEAGAVTGEALNISGGEFFA